MGQLVSPIGEPNSVSSGYRCPCRKSKPSHDCMSSPLCDAGLGLQMQSVLCHKPAAPRPGVQPGLNSIHPKQSCLAFIRYCAKFHLQSEFFISLCLIVPSLMSVKLMGNTLKSKSAFKISVTNLLPQRRKLERSILLLNGTC